MNIAAMIATQTAMRVSTQLMLNQAEKKRKKEEERKKKEEEEKKSK